LNHKLCTRKPVVATHRWVRQDDTPQATWARRMWDKWDVGCLKMCQSLGTANVLLVVSPLLTILMCGQRHGPAFVPPFECDRRFHTGKSGSAASFQRQRWLSISARRHNEGKDPDRCHSVARRTPLIGRRARQQFGSNQMGRTLPAWAHAQAR